MPRMDKKKPKPRVKHNPGVTTGTPTLYDESYDAIAEEMCALGATDSDLASFFKVTVATILNWERRNKSFFEAINTGKDIYDNRRIKGTLRDRALGYNWQEESVERTEIEAEKVVVMQDGTVATVRDDKGRKILVRVPAVKTKTTNKHVPAEPVCIFFWLTNRNREKWQHVRVNKVEGKLDMPAQIVNNYSFEDIPKEELEQLSNTLAKAAARRSEEQSSKGNGTSKSGTA